MSTINKKGSSWNAEDTILVDTITELKGVVKKSGIIFTKGQDTVGDGKHGSFVYDVNAPRSTANGTTIIDHTNTGVGNGCWLRQVAVNTGGVITKETVLNAESYIDQNPTAVDTPLQLTFGAAQSNAEVSVDASGAITFHKGGHYSFQLGLQPGRSTGTGEAILFVGWLINGSPVGNTVSFTMKDIDFSFPFRSSFEYDIPAGAVVTSELIRDSAGVDDGGVRALSPTLAGRPSTYSAAVTISKFVTTESI